MDFHSFIRSRTATAALGLALCLLLFLSVRLYIQKYEVQKEIDKLEDQAAKIDSENSQLAELIKYLDTPEYTEKQAREKLNLKKEGEQVVVLPESVLAEGQIAGSYESEAKNPQKWFNYLFGRN